MPPSPSTHGPNGESPKAAAQAPLATAGRDTTTGRFAKGWRGGKGNPLAGKVAKLRAAMINAVSASDLRDVIRAMIAQAKAGDVAAARELLDRLLGKPVEMDLLERLDELESLNQETNSCQR